MNKKYIEHKEKAVVADERFEHVMAITLDPRTNFKDGIIRCIIKRIGDVSIKGFQDRSELHKITSDSEGKFIIGKKLNIKNENKILENLKEEGLRFIGFEDPDIWIDGKTNLIHVYFTIPFISEDKNKYQSKIHLGHAVGRDLDSLEITQPVLLNDVIGIAKELSIAPLNKEGFRYNLVESSDKIGNTKYSTVRCAVAKDMGEAWEFGETVFHPAKENIPWIAGDASPGPLFPETFIHIGEGKRVGVINGREANQIIDGKTIYGIFSVGLFIYDYEEGKIDWVSKEPFIRDSEAKIITFASQFIENETKNGKGTLYAHVDDSFVRAYDLDAEKIKTLLPD